ncbi:hypothetical protein SAMD00019534_068180, partial [Acytostelium subglobosum LB1]|uniref:hypothetical protein n=1 Tax=Acytostelium subglobosum LB1 TaxID=1410327 RepID=UPI000644FD82
MKRITSVTGITKQLIGYRTSQSTLGVVSMSSSSLIGVSSKKTPNVRYYSATETSPSSTQSTRLHNNKKVLFDDDKFYHEEKYTGISKEPFSEDIAKILLTDLNTDDIEIKPDGLLYLPEIKYRRILNQAFGPGGWALKPFGPPIVENGSLIRPYALYCLGRYVSESIGEQPYSEQGYISFATATEAAKSNALVRCCKDLGIGSSLWDPNFIREWKQRYALEKFYEHAKTKERKKLWTLKSGPAIGYPWKEVSPIGESTSPIQETIAYQGQEEKETPIVSASSTSSTTSSSSQPKEQQQQGEESAELDIDHLVPSVMKKYNGKTWREVINDPKGPSYIKWAAGAFTGTVQMQARAISDWIEQNQQHQQ